MYHRRQLLFDFGNRITYWALLCLKDMTLASCFTEFKKSKILDGQENWSAASDKDRNMLLLNDQIRKSSWMCKNRNFSSDTIRSMGACQTDKPASERAWKLLNSYNGISHQLITLINCISIQRIVSRMNYLYFPIWERFCQKSMQNCLNPIFYNRINISHFRSFYNASFRVNQ